MDKVTSADGTTIAFERMGTGSAIILVAGALNDRNGPASGTPLAAQLASHFTVFAYDRRGRGDSGDTPPYAVDREVEDIDALIAAAGGSAFVYGMSSGAALALRAAAQGLAITKLALYEPPFVPDDDQARRSAREYAASLTALLSAGHRGDAVVLFMTRVGMPAKMIDQMRESPMWQGLETLAPTLAYDSAVLGDSNSGGILPRDQVASITLPTLVLDGDASPPFLRHAAEAIAGALPNAAHRSLAGQTHAVDPKVLAPALAEFFGA